MTRGKASRGTTARRVRAVVRASGRLERDVPSGEAVKTMKTAKAREVAARAAGGDGGDRAGSAFSVKTYNAISPVGLDKFPKGKYSVSGDDAALEGAPMAMMLRSHKL